MQDENEEAAQAAPSLIRLFDYGFDVVFPRLPVCRNDASIHRLSVHGQVNRALLVARVVEDMHLVLAAAELARHGQLVQLLGQARIDLQAVVIRLDA